MNDLTSSLRKPEWQKVDHSPLPWEHQPISHNQLLLSHLTNKGRYRLGVIRSLWWVGVIYMLGTAFLYWGYWFKLVTTEVCLHLDHPLSESVLARKRWIMLPGVHAILCYRLARLILQMEVQNGYQSVSPSVAFLLSAFPPFDMVYLQKSLNHHWLLHAEACLKGDN